MPDSNREPQVNYANLLISLGEEYIAAARAMAAGVASSHPGYQVDQYHRILATGLGCFESVLNNFKIAPREEARLQLRYASLLIEETENDAQAEEILGKGVPFCERHRFTDLKYSMQHLQARMLSRSNPRAANKFLDNLIHEAEAYQHSAWVYALRFLRVSLSLRSFSQQELPSILQNLKSTASWAQRHGDTAVFVTSFLLEASAHSRSLAADATEDAQRAIAVARSLQLDPSIRGVPQLAALLALIDVACSTQRNNADQSTPKMQVLRTVVDQMNSDARWAHDGSIAVPLANDGGISEYTAGIFARDSQGTVRLTFRWLSRTDVYSLALLLSGVWNFNSNSQDGHKSEQFLFEGIRTVSGMSRAGMRFSPY